MGQNTHDEYQDYLDERKELVISERETACQFDKAILTLAAGALALSITFINYIAPTPKPSSICLLIIAWTFFGISILSTLISFLTSQAACRRQREILDDKSTSGKNLAAVWTNRLNYVSIFFFIVGVFFLIIFCAINLPKGGEKVMDEKLKQRKIIEEGFVPPKPPVKPEDIEKRGYVPPKPPVKPPEKPNDKK